MPPFEIAINDSILNDSERARASQYRQPADRIRYLATRVALRKLLGFRLKLKPAYIHLITTQRGRLELAGAEQRLSFNVSHSGRHAGISRANRE
ncbi:4'-phosphopantetheinyl transferase family protein [Trinickia mobilis]|uniref:4'-phosphopantetheinyl transferase family protein n=1 Tax=Trinickia mobilis TaxID=2816356 RepID=UPI0035ABCD58